MFAFNMYYFLLDEGNRIFLIKILTLLSRLLGYLLGKNVTFQLILGKIQWKHDNLKMFLNDMAAAEPFLHRFTGIHREEF
jgi:hypothetical protein